MNAFIRRAAALVLLGFAAVAHADVTVYRGIDYKNATYAKVNDSQWRVDSDGISTFELANFSSPTKRCMVSFVILDVNSKPAQGTRGQIQNMPPGYVAEYTPDYGAGHWSLKAPVGVGDAALKAAVTEYVIAQQVAQVNTTYTGTAKSTCTTPTEPN